VLPRCLGLQGCSGRAVPAGARSGGRRLMRV